MSKGRLQQLFCGLWIYSTRSRLSAFLCVTLETLAEETLVHMRSMELESVDDLSKRHGQDYDELVVQSILHLPPKLPAPTKRFQRCALMKRILWWKWCSREQFALRVKPVNMATKNLKHSLMCFFFAAYSLCPHTNYLI